MALEIHPLLIIIVTPIVAPNFALAVGLFTTCFGQTDGLLMPANALLPIYFFLYRRFGIEPPFLENLLEAGLAHLGSEAAQGSFERLVVMNLNAEIRVTHNTPICLENSVVVDPSKHSKGTCPTGEPPLWEDIHE